MTRLTSRSAPLAPSLLILALATQVACDSGDEDGTMGGGTGGTTAGTGGTTAATGGAPATGGDSSTGGSATGGSTAGTGGAGTGGDTGTAFTCPSGYEGAVPTLVDSDSMAVSSSPVETAPALDGSNSFLEGPVWADGVLYVSQIRDYGPLNPARILEYTPGAGFEVLLEDSGTNGIALRSDGKLVGASHGEGGLVLIDPTSPVADDVLVDTYMGNRFNSPNDLAIRSDGNIYFTDPDYQCGSPCTEEEGYQGENRVYRVTPSGTVESIPTDHTAPNGIALSPDENTLYVAGTSALVSYPLMADGSVGTAQPFASSSGVDGLAIDCAGNVYATVHAQQKIDVFSPAGSSLGQIDVGGNVTNAAFGGADNTTLYVTLYNTQLEAVELDVPGYPY